MHLGGLGRQAQFQLLPIGKVFELACLRRVLGHRILHRLVKELRFSGPHFVDYLWLLAVEDRLVAIFLSSTSGRLHFRHEVDCALGACLWIGLLLFGCLYDSRCVGVFFDLLLRLFLVFLDLCSFVVLLVALLDGFGHSSLLALYHCGGR